jgi:hypothetical protein
MNETVVHPLVVEPAPGALEPWQRTDHRNPTQAFEAQAGEPAQSPQPTSEPTNSRRPIPVECAAAVTPSVWKRHQARRSGVA